MPSIQAMAASPKGPRRTVTSVTNPRYAAISLSTDFKATWRSCTNLRFVAGRRLGRWSVASLLLP